MPNPDESQWKCEEGRLIWTMKPACTFRTEYCGSERTQKVSEGWRLDMPAPF